MFRTTSRSRVLFALSGIALLATACRESTPAAGTLTFARDNSAKSENIYLGFSGDDSGIPGVHLDPVAMQKMLEDPSLGLNFQTRIFRSATLRKMQDESAQAARDLLPAPQASGQANLKPRGTLFWHVSSHGMANGRTLSADEVPFTFASIASKIREARGNVPFERLIVFYDTCYSGQNVDGNVAINNGTGANPLSLMSAFAAASWLGRGRPEAGSAGTALANANSLAESVLQEGEKGLAQQFMLFGASSKRQTSLDTEAGGMGTQAFIKAFKNLRRGQRPPAGAYSADLGAVSLPEYSRAELETDSPDGGWGARFGALQAVNSRAPAAPGNCATAGDLEVSMRNFARGQTPVARFLPEKLKDECLFEKTL